MEQQRARILATYRNGGNPVEQFTKIRLLVIGTVCTGNKLNGNRQGDVKHAHLICHHPIWGGFVESGLVPTMCVFMSNVTPKSTTSTMAGHERLDSR